MDRLRSPQRAAFGWMNRQRAFWSGLTTAQGINQGPQRTASTMIIDASPWARDAGARKNKGRRT